MNGIVPPVIHHPLWRLLDATSAPTTLLTPPCPGRHLAHVSQQQAQWLLRFHVYTLTHQSGAHLHKAIPIELEDARPRYQRETDNSSEEADAIAERSTQAAQGSDASITSNAADQRADSGDTGNGGTFLTASAEVEDGDTVRSRGLRAMQDVVQRATGLQPLSSSLATAVTHLLKPREVTKSSLDHQTALQSKYRRALANAQAVDSSQGGTIFDGIISDSEGSEVEEAEAEAEEEDARAEGNEGDLPGGDGASVATSMVSNDDEAHKRVTEADRKAREVLNPLNRVGFDIGIPKPGMYCHR